MIFERGDALDKIAGAPKNKGKRTRINSGRLSVDETTDELDLDKVFVLERDSASSRGKGYLFLAVMFGLMGCSNYNGAIVSDTSAPEVARPKHFIQRDVKSLDLGDDHMESKFSNMNLANSDVSDELISELELTNTQ
jgi:hypothetical protein